MEDTKTINFRGKNFKIYINEYSYGGVIYVGLYYDENGYWAPYTNITVNIPDEFLPTTIEEFDMAPIDTNNCYWAEQFLTMNNLAVDTGREVQSGFCTYPIYKFNREELKKYEIKLED